MATQQTPDDIKIIAQFLAGLEGPGSEWPALTRDAFRLRRELKERGGYTLARSKASPPG
jgi:hypothetical protein